MVNSYTLTSYKTWVRNRLDDTSFSDSLLTQFANDENRDITNEAEWPFMRTTTTGTLATGTNSNTVGATNLQAYISLVITTNSYEKYLKPVGFEWLDATYPDPSSLTTNTPTVWVPLNSTTFLVGPAYPDQAYAYTLRYVKEATTLSSDSDTLDVPNVFSEVVVLGMLARAHMANDNYDTAQVIQQEREIKLEQMKKRLLRPQFGENPRMLLRRGKIDNTFWS